MTNWIKLSSYLVDLKNVKYLEKYDARKTGIRYQIILYFTDSDNLIFDYETDKITRDKFFNEIENKLCSTKLH